jgi:hypothetical protein
MTDDVRTASVRLFVEDGGVAWTPFFERVKRLPWARILTDAVLVFAILAAGSNILFRR